MTSIAYLNGEFMPLDQARISPLDRGYLFGDGVYEVIPVYGGRLFRLREHLLRLLEEAAREALRAGEIVHRIRSFVSLGESKLEPPRSITASRACARTSRAPRPA